MIPRVFNSNWLRFTQTVHRLRTSRHPGSDIPITDIAEALGWSFEDTQELAAEMTEMSMIDTDMGLGSLPTVVEAP